ncbi:hypothetical protein [Nocardioides sp.]|uniref:hypothetical protein n=1 Tax=Nocardioides sp. TaxID=35761 RepID=UPI003D1364ED
MASRIRVQPRGRRRTALAIAALTLRPTALATIVAALTVLPLAWWFGSAWAGLALVGQLALGFWVSFAAHEVAHAVTLPPEAGPAVEGTWSSVYVCASPDLVGARSAAAGPVVGTLTCLLLGAAGLAALAWVPLAFLHLVNLTSLCPDGRILRESVGGQ